ncbi:MAG: hypothetical protein R3C05_31190 [Pirellulaceae bacterium]
MSNWLPEPDIVNPVAMTFDVQGRIWVTESFEYPRREPGPGRDRIKVLEDKDNDGRFETVTVFAEGLNIPSGIAVGHGGVWVANAPDILFMQDTDGDLKADKTEVVVTGFGRDDTHELPNAFEWGPDGCLYGLNGVFNPSHVKQGDREYHFTCAMFRIDPRTRKFDLFCEGTSNPWGIAFDSEGSAFISACVIDHLWHLTETGYYHRQGGPYPPHTWKIESIVNHKHQMAAYCGIHYFDSPAYPPEYRDLLYMGNIHGNCINVDRLHRRGSTYHATPEEDFLTANDVWFMPVAQKLGPDGSLYVLDWYDRYHCYQDANHDPAGVDRGHGRLYRVRYEQTPRAKPFNLNSESSRELVSRLSDPNAFYRRGAAQVLNERHDAAVREQTEAIVLDPKIDSKTRMAALWALIGTGSLDKDFHLKILASDASPIQSWGVRAAGNYGDVDPSVRDAVVALSTSSKPDVLLQVAIASRKLPDVDANAMLANVIGHCGDDDLIPQIVWRNLEPLIPADPRRFMKLIQTNGFAGTEGFKKLAPHITKRLISL